MSLTQSTLNGKQKAMLVYTSRKQSRLMRCLATLTSKKLCLTFADLTIFQKLRYKKSMMLTADFSDTLVVIFFSKVARKSSWSMQRITGRATRYRPPNSRWLNGLMMCLRNLTRLNQWSSHIRTLLCVSSKLTNNTKRLQGSFWTFFFIFLTWPSLALVLIRLWNKLSLVV